MADNRFSTNRYKRQQQQLTDRLAGLTLREEAQREQAAANDERSAQSAERIALDRQKMAYDVQKDALDKRLQFEALDQSVKYQGALSRMDVRDPDFEYRLSTLNKTFPYASLDPALKTYREAKLAAHAEVRKNVDEISRTTGISPWASNFVKRDETGNWLGTDSESHAQAVQSKRLAAAKEAAASFPSGGTVKVEAQPGVVVTADSPSAAAAVIANANNLKPGETPGLLNKGSAEQVLAQAAVGAVENAAIKQTDNANRAKLQAIKAQIDSFGTAAKLFDPATKTKFAELQKQLDEVIGVEPEPTPAAPAAVNPKLQTYKDLLK